MSQKGRFDKILNIYSSWNEVILRIRDYCRRKVHLRILIVSQFTLIPTDFRNLNRNLTPTLAGDLWKAHLVLIFYILTLSWNFNLEWPWISFIRPFCQNSVKADWLSITEIDITLNLVYPQHFLKNWESAFENQIFQR